SGNNNTEFSYVYRVDLKSPEWSFGNFNLGVSGLWGNDSVNDVASGATGAGGTSVHDNSTSVSVTDVALTWSKPFGFDPLTLGAEWYLMNNETRVTTGGGAGAAGTVENNSADDMVAALYAKWQVTDWLYFAGRGEYWDADARTAAGRGIYNSASAFAPLAAGGTDSIAVYSGTLTAGFNVWKDTLVRLEYRHDEVAGKENGFINAQSNVNGTAPSIRSGQDTIALNVAYSF
ncbi:MAG: outer membrane beta-barrel protein, partial [Verrucomicrobiae bacterium]|nr:outer membrane beta-barrel protein [Verrucomicrobiae bacterium]